MTVTAGGFRYNPHEARRVPAERPRKPPSGLLDARPMQDPDHDDVQASQHGDRDAYTRIIERHQAAIVRQMRRFTPDVALREELAQDVFVEAWLSIGHFRPHAPFLHWLQTIATRVGYKYWKELQRRKRYVPLRDDDAAPAVEEEPSSLIPEDAAERLAGLLGRLAPEDRLVLTMTYFDGCSAGEIAERLGWNAALVRMRAFRARRKLKRWLEGKR